MGIMHEIFYFISVCVVIFGITALLLGLISFIIFYFHVKIKKK